MAKSRKMPSDQRLTIAIAMAHPRRVPVISNDISNGSNEGGFQNALPKKEGDAERIIMRAPHPICPFWKGVGMQCRRPGLGRPRRLARARPEKKQRAHATRSYVLSGNVRPVRAPASRLVNSGFVNGAGWWTRLVRERSTCTGLRCAAAGSSRVSLVVL